MDRIAAIAVLAGLFFLAGVQGNPSPKGKHHHHGGDHHHQTTSITPPYTKVCAKEGEKCSCNGAVRYGKGSTWTKWRSVTGYISCSNKVFGDPIPYTVKECQCGSSVGAECKDLKKKSRCLKQLKKGCTTKFAKKRCQKTCGFCTTEPTGHPTDDKGHDHGKGHHHEHGHGKGHHPEHGKGHGHHDHKDKHGHDHKHKHGHDHKHHHGHHHEDKHGDHTDDHHGLHHGSSCRTTKSIKSKNPDPNKACIFPFKYQGKEFTDCTTTNNNDIFWCATKVNSKGEYKSGKWGVCSEECLHRDECMSTKSGKECVFPFTYSDEEHEECTTAAGYDDWCATSVDKYGKMKEWDYCHVPCGTCETQSNRGACIFPFKYKDEFHYSCTREPNDTYEPWCAITTDKHSKMTDWAYCKLNGNCKVEDEGHDHGKGHHHEHGHGKGHHHKHGKGHGHGHHHLE